MGALSSHMQTELNLLELLRSVMNTFLSRPPETKLVKPSLAYTTKCIKLYTLSYIFQLLDQNIVEVQSANTAKRYILIRLSKTQIYLKST